MSYWPEGMTAADYTDAPRRCSNCEENIEDYPEDQELCSWCLEDAAQDMKDDRAFEEHRDERGSDR